MSTEIAIPEREQKEQDALTRVREWEIASNEDYSALDTFLVGLGQLRNSIIADFAEAKKAAFEAHRKIVKQEDGHISIVEEARRIGKTKLKSWSDEQERIRQEEEDRLRAEAQKRAEEEAIRAAEEAEKNGNKEEAEAIISEPIITPAIVLSKSVPKRATTIRMTWKFRITNPNLVPRQYLKVDEVKIGGVIRSLGSTADIPGVQAYQEAV